MKNCIRVKKNLLNALERLLLLFRSSSKVHRTSVHTQIVLVVLESDCGTVLLRFQFRCVTNRYDFESQMQALGCKCSNALASLRFLSVRFLLLIRMHDLVD